MENITHRLSFDTPIGIMMLVSDGTAITRVYLPTKPNEWTGTDETALLLEGKTQMLEYLAGTRRIFTLPLAPHGTAFQQKVWAELKKIPYGETRSYGDIAKAIDNPKGSRAVGMANNKNPLSILVPCHRVIGGDGKLVGYGGGLSLKIALLEREGIVVVKNVGASCVRPTKISTNETRFISNFFE